MRRKFIAYCLIIITALYGCSNNDSENTIDVSLNSKMREYTNLENEINCKLISNKWYLSQLTSESDRRIYEIIYNSLVNRTDSIEVEVGDASKLNYLFKCVMYDNPDLFYVDSYQYIQCSNDIIILLPVFNMSITEMEEAENKIKEYVDNVLGLIKPEMSNYEKELLIYTYIAENTEYDIESEYNQTLYSVTLGKSVCIGYAKMFQYICHQANIPCTIVIGQDRNEIRHAWNVVFIDNNWYMVDCTQSKGLLGDSKEQVNYYYFNITEEQLARSYGIDYSIKIPQCKSIEAEYFNKNGLYFKQVDIERYKGLIEEAKEKEQNNLVIRCANINVLNETVKQFINGEELFNMFEVNTSISKLINPELLIIKLEWKDKNWRIT